MGWLDSGSWIGSDRHSIREAIRAVLAQLGEYALALTQEANLRRDAEAERDALRKELMLVAIAMGSPKDVDRLPEALSYVLASYRTRTEKAEAEAKWLKECWTPLS